MRFLLACGGTGGHIYPALSVAHTLKKEGHDVLFVGAPWGLEKKLVPREGFDIKTVDVRSLTHSLSPKAMLRNAGVLVNMVRSLRQADKIVREWNPAAALGTGGYASFPPLRAAARRGVPVFVHESNAIPGVATKMLAAEAVGILVSHEACRESYRSRDREKVKVVGTPVKSEFFMANRVLAREKLGLDNRPLIVSFFGSRGAREMNRLLADMMVLEAGDEEFQHIHATSMEYFEWIKGYISERGVDLASHPGLRLQEYIFDMPDVMAAADIVISRSGASTLAELMAAQKPSILIPSPNVVADHQTSNAKALAALGGAVLVPEHGLDAAKLYEYSLELLRNRAKLDKMAFALREACVSDSAQRIASLMTDVGKRSAQ